MSAIPIKNPPTNDPSLLRLIFLIGLVASVNAVAPPARASTDLLNVYVGGAYGHADLEAEDTGLVSAVPGSRLGSFDVGHVAWQASVGVRGLEFLGAEIDYFDLGRGNASPSWSGGLYGLTNAQISQRGEAAFAMLYLPLPVVSAYLKAGAAHLNTELYAATAGPVCAAGAPCPAIALPPANGDIQTTATGFAAGAGVQWRIDTWTIRGEYERFTALGEHPSLLSVGITLAIF